MIIKPIINGVVARSAHPYGCQAAIQKQIQYVKHSAPIATTPKRVLILGASSGFGLAARIALTFGGANADTIGVSFERGPSEKSLGSAGWYNNIFFKQEAEKAGRVAVNIVADAFAPETRETVIEAIETYFEGEVDLIIYSLATGVRPNYASGTQWQSSIKPIGDTVTGGTVLLENDQWVDTTIEPATQEEIDATVKVMGGEDWESWVDTLINADSIAEGCQTLAFSYIGSEANYPIYRDGTLGWAKVDLHQASHSLNLKLAQYHGAAYATVCKALVTKASVFIPTFTPYIIALYQAMKEDGSHEECIQQMQRLFRDKLFQEQVPVDAERLIRMDDWEMKPKIQQRVKELMSQINANTFKEIGDYQGYKKAFMQLNGFDIDGVNYQIKINPAPLYHLKP